MGLRPPYTTTPLTGSQLSKFLCRSEMSKFGGCSLEWEGIPGPKHTPACPKCGSIYFVWVDHELTKYIPKRSEVEKIH